MLTSAVLYLILSGINQIFCRWLFQYSFSTCKLEKYWWLQYEVYLRRFSEATCMSITEIFSYQLVCIAYSAIGTIVFKCIQKLEKEAHGLTCASLGNSWIERMNFDKRRSPFFFFVLILAHDIQGFLLTMSLSGLKKCNWLLIQCNVCKRLKTFWQFSTKRSN